MFSNIFEPQHNHFPRRQYAYPQANNYFGDDTYAYNPYYSQRRRRHPNYYTEDELFQMQKEKALRQEKLLLERQQEEKRKQEAENRRREQLKQRQLFLVRAKIATRVIQRAWRAYCTKRDEKIRAEKQFRLEQLRAQQEKAAFVITRAMRDFGPVHRAKQIANSLRKLQSIQDQVEAVDPATAIRKGPGISLFEHTIDKLIAQVDLIDSYGDVTVRSRRKAVVLLATERVTKVLEEQQQQQQLKQQQNEQNQSSQAVSEEHRDNEQPVTFPTESHMDVDDSEIDTKMDVDIESPSKVVSESSLHQPIAEDESDSEYASSSEEKLSDHEEEMLDEDTENQISELTHTLTDLNNQLRQHLVSSHKQLEDKPTLEGLNTMIRQVQNALAAFTQ